VSFDPYTAQTAIEKLAKRHRVRIWWHTQDDIPEAHIGTRQVWLIPVVAPYSYLAALHELGHVIDRDARRLHAKGATLSCEAAAWEWAFNHCDPAVLAKVGKRTRKLIYLAWGTYLSEEVD
jgi:hypothetical protein